jgi:hypothetical protein
MSARSPAYCAPSWDAFRASASDHAECMLKATFFSSSINSSQYELANLAGLWVEAYVGYVFAQSAACGFDLISAYQSCAQHIASFVTIDAYMAYGQSNFYDVNLDCGDPAIAAILIDRVLPSIGECVPRALAHKLAFVLVLLSALGSDLDRCTLEYGLSHMSTDESAHMLRAVTRALDLHSHTNAGADTGIDPSEYCIDVSFLLTSVKRSLCESTSDFSENKPQLQLRHLPTPAWATCTGDTKRLNPALLPPLLPSC